MLSHTKADRRFPEGDMVDTRDNNRTDYGLLSAVTMANAALGADPSTRTLRTAARSLSRELGRIARDVALWDEFTGLTELSEFRASNLPRDGLRLIGDVFIGTLATQLTRAGWHYPPAPSAGSSWAGFANRAPAAAASGATCGAHASSLRTMDAPASLMTCACSAGGCDSASGTATPPARQMP